MTDLTLLITTIGHLISSGILGVSGVLVLMQNPRRTLNRAFFVAALGAGIFGLSLAVGINLDPSPLAYGVWMINLVDIFIVSAYLHFIFAALHAEARARFIIIGVYVVGAVILVASLFFPQLFLPELTPKLFTKSYLNAGPLYVAMFLYFSFVFFLAFVVLLRAYFSQKENRTQIEYFIFATILGYGFAPIDFFLVFDIPVSPLYGMFFGLYMIPIAYGILADQLMDIRIVLKRALFYSLGIGITAGVLTLLISLNDLLTRSVPWIRFWMVPIFTASIAFVVGRLFWLKLVENDQIKYEFITVATHKLRTPLTQISWGIRSLLDTHPTKEERDIIEHIQHSTNRLIELTNILFETTEEDSQEYVYSTERVGLIQKTNEVLEKLQPVIQHKHINVNVHADEEVWVFADARRMTSVIEVFLENAINYTPPGGLVQIITYRKGKRAVYSVRDTGIGVSPAEKKLIFSRFYRTDAARRMDTEGVGLGLAMAQSIIKKHKGSIGVDSEGENKGSVFWFSLPL